jgi:CelD/BcsL family acetyltransferase involved in cellulose biosynthesis
LERPLLTRGAREPDTPDLQLELALEQSLPPPYLPKAAPSLAIVTGRRDGRLVMVWPLTTERVAGLSQLAWMGDPVSQYGDILVEPEAAPLLGEAWSFIAHELKPDLVRLRKVRDDATIAQFLGDLSALPAERLQAPYLDLASAPDFAAFERRYSPRARRNRRRPSRRLAEQGKMAFERCSEGARARELAIKAVELKREWLNERGIGSPALADPSFASFFADVATGLSIPPDARCRRPPPTTRPQR